MPSGMHPDILLFLNTTIPTFPWILSIVHLPFSSFPFPFYPTCIKTNHPKTDQLIKQLQLVPHFLQKYQFATVAFRFLWELFFFKSIPEDIFTDFREEERQRERKKHQYKRNTDWLPPTCDQTRDQTPNLGMCPNRGSNPQPFSVWDNAPNDYATWPGL